VLLPNNSERIQTISEVFRENIERHEENGGTYYDERAGLIAKEAIETFMPGLVNLQGQRLVVEAIQGIALHDERAVPHEGLHVEAKLTRVSIQQLTSTIKDKGFGTVALTSYDLFAVLEPRFKDPDPVEIVFGDALLVPFAGIEHFDLANT
jgi:hypothetical protein